MSLKTDSADKIISEIAISSCELRSTYIGKYDQERSYVLCRFCLNPLFEPCHKSSCVWVRSRAVLDPIRLQDLEQERARQETEQLAAAEENKRKQQIQKLEEDLKRMKSGS